MDMNALSALDALRMKTDKTPLENAVALFADYELEARQDGRNIIAALAAAELAAKSAELESLHRTDQDYRDVMSGVQEFVHERKLGIGGEDVDKLLISYCKNIEAELESLKVERDAWKQRAKQAAYIKADDKVGFDWAMLEQLEDARAVVEAARKYTDLNLSDENCPNCLRRISDGHDNGCELEELAAALERVKGTK